MEPSSDADRAEDLAEADRQLHDSRLDLDTIVLEDGTFQMNGYAVGIHRGRAARFALRIRVSRVRAWRLDDDARIGVLDIHEVRETDEGLALESHFPTTLTLTTDRPIVEIDQASVPFSVWRWGRWKAVEPRGAALPTADG